MVMTAVLVMVIAAIVITTKLGFPIPDIVKSSGDGVCVAISSICHCFCFCYDYWC